MSKTLTYSDLVKISNGDTIKYNGTSADVKEVHKNYMLKGIINNYGISFSCNNVYFFIPTGVYLKNMITPYYTYTPQSATETSNWNLIGHFRNNTTPTSNSKVHISDLPHKLKDWDYHPHITELLYTPKLPTPNPQPGGKRKKNRSIKKRKTKKPRTYKIEPKSYKRISHYNIPF